MSATEEMEIGAWIKNEKEMGVNLPDILRKLTDVGWKENDATLQIEIALGVKRLDKPTALFSVKDHVKSPIPVPDADLSDSPLYIDVNNHRISVLGSMKHPRMIMFGNVVTDEECDHLISNAKSRIEKSTVVSHEDGTNVFHGHRTSSGMFYGRGETELIATIEKRIAQLLNWPVEKGERMQILQYNEGAQYKSHYDFFDTNAEHTSKIIQHGGNRVGTLVIYLNEPEMGGSTAFTDIGFEVNPKKGNAVFFSYDTPDAASLTMHAGSPVIKGEKWIAVKWMRAENFST